MTMLYPKCISCKNYFGMDKCRAFPDGIPRNILNGNFDHSEKHPEQKNDVLYEQRKDAPNK